MAGEEGELMEVQEAKSQQQLRKEVKHYTAWLASLEKGTALLAEVASAAEFSPYRKLAAAYNNFDMRSKAGTCLLFRVVLSDYNNK